MGQRPWKVKKSALGGCKDQGSEGGKWTPRARNWLRITVRGKSIAKTGPDRMDLLPLSDEVITC